jgi:hypothetical protein
MAYHLAPRITCASPKLRDLLADVYDSSRPFLQRRLDEVNHPVLFVAPLGVRAVGLEGEEPGPLGSHDARRPLRNFMETA